MSEYVPRGSQTDPRGVVIALFQKNTFTETDDFIELYQNSDDASSKMMKVKLISYNGKPFLFISDDGLGMDMETMDMSLNLLGETNGERTHGKFNFGGKAGQLHLSGINDYLQSGENYRGKCVVISKKADCNAVCYEMIGRVLIERGWNGQVQPHEILSGHESIDSRELYNEYPIDETGTHIFIELTESRVNKLKECEQELRGELALACNERLNQCGMSICFNGSDDGILQYTPILKEDIIDEKKRSTNIDVYMKGTDKLYVVEEDGVKKAIKLISVIRESYTTELKELSESDLNGYEKKGTFILSSACDYVYTNGHTENEGRDNNIYVIRNGFCLNKYNNTILQSRQRRNTQYNSRGYTEKGVYSNTRFILTYESDEITDSLIGVNMQKADIKFEKLEKPFQRTIERLVVQHSENYIEYILQNIPASEPDPVPEPVPQQVPGSDSESESESEDLYTSPSSSPRSISSEPQPEPEPEPQQYFGSMDYVSQETESKVAMQMQEDEEVRNLSLHGNPFSPVEVHENLKMMLEEKILVYLNDDRDDSEMNNEILKILENYGY